MRCFMLALSLSTLLACGGESGNGGVDAGFTGETHRLTWGPVNVPAGTEDTQCIWLRLDNENEIRVHSLHNVLSGGSHHLIVYKDDMDTVEQTTPTPCQPFTGALNSSGMIAPITITQKADDRIFLPDRVAYTFAPHQMVKLEMHYLNATDDAEMVTASVDFYEAKVEDIDYEASILFTGSPDIDIPAGPAGEATLHQFFTVPAYLDLSGAKIFAITGHTHSLGTDVNIRVAPAKTGPMTEVYAPKPFSWSEPETRSFDQPFTIPPGGGFDFECSWKNTRTSGGNVGWGESATKEMCFFWAYYYPSQGSKVCFHTDRYGGAAGVNVCCPGDSLCSAIEQMF